MKCPENVMKKFQGLCGSGTNRDTRAYVILQRILLVQMKAQVYVVLQRITLVQIATPESILFYKESYYYK